MSKRPDAKAFENGATIGAGGLSDQMVGKRPGRKATAIPGGGTGPNWAYKFKTAEGYRTNKEMAAAASIGGQDSLAAIKGQTSEPLSESQATGTSIFDPVLTELAYRWFCPPGGTILDPFAGGSVRGIVASELGRAYVGVELRAEQVEANRRQGQAICKAGPAPRWVHGDSQNIPELAGDVQADFVFSCPPYADLEVYSDDPRDLSTMAYEDFRQAYERIIAAACAQLKPNRFACFVVGDARGKDGCYYGFPWHTIDAFQKAGLRLYNEAVLVTAVGSLPIRAGKQFQASRKLGKTHQNILVFVKGDPRAAADAVGPVDFGEADELLQDSPSPAAGLGGELTDPWA